MVLTAFEKVPWGVTDCWQRRCPRLRGPELGPVIQRVDQLGCQLDVVAHNLFVLGDAIDVADSTGQVSVHTRAQLTFPELEEQKAYQHLPREAAIQRLALLIRPVIRLNRQRKGTRRVLFTVTAPEPSPETTTVHA